MTAHEQDAGAPPAGAADAAAARAASPAPSTPASPAASPAAAPARRGGRSNLAADTRRLREIKSKRFPWYVLESLLFENGYQAVVLHRVAHWFKHRRIPVLGPLIARLTLFLTGADIAPGAQIGPGLLISHGVGLVIGGWARIGAGATLHHQVTIGGPYTARRSEMPVIGDDVFIGAGAKIIGGIRVGDRVFIAVDAIVTEDVPDDSFVVSRAGIEIRPRRE